MTESEIREILEAPHCWCGRVKGMGVGHSVCNHCWKKLEREERASLLISVEAGLAISYDRCIEVLKKRARPLHAVPPKPIREVPKGAR